MNKRTLLSLRFVLILATILVMTYSKRGLNVFAPGYTIALIYFVSNIFLYFLTADVLAKALVSFSIFLFDILTISLGIYFTQGVETDFYLIYFLVIFIAAIGHGVRGSIPIAVVASIIYGWMIHRTDPGVSLLDPKYLIRIPFLFIISLVSSYWSQSTRREIRRKKELEEFTRQLETEVARVTEKETELREYSEKVLNSVTSGVIAVRMDGMITTLNPEAESILELKREEAIGKNIKEIKRLNALWEKMQQSINSGSLVLREEVPITTSDSEPIPIGTSISPITGANENLTGCVAIFRDLSEMRALEEKLKQAERLSYLGKMASWVAHEIRNPLTAIGGFAQLLENTDDKEKIKLFSSEINKGTQRINNIIDDILAFARTKRKVAYTDINLKSLIESITNNLTNIDVSIGSAKPPTIKGEIDTVRRLFINLINNSIEALEENGRLEINFSEENNYCITEIIDNGKGISKQDMKKLFTPFHTTKQRGTGLGLSIVKKTVDEHNGKIEVRSKKGKGTRVRVYLPIQPTMNSSIT